MMTVLAMTTTKLVIARTFTCVYTFVDELPNDSALTFDLCMFVARARAQQTSEKQAKHRKNKQRGKDDDRIHFRFLFLLGCLINFFFVISEFFSFF